MNAVGLLELNSIAAGFLAADTMLKAADVELVVSRSICSGKYMVIIGGQAATVKAAIEAGIESCRGSVVDSLVTHNVHPDVFPAIAGSVSVAGEGALGILEAFSVASLIEGADEAAKTADVKLVEIRLAMALGGKAFVTMMGDVSAVRAAVDAGAIRIAAKGMLVNKMVIPSPHPQLLREQI